ncbi:hypothetical protein A9Q84_14505 [Halobacteriovorax marinus]|uniref:Uncharacterized protein n=1 Tax=Halobacteriovorax marinus TaxID=97084 RepID=A0A1Y5F5D7_9BACT|nr:hypothetical protein A9Q84_14505 [Halobacteriovorax marinus]
MSSLFREMMPDNLMELAFTGGLTMSISFLSLKAIKYYRNQGLSVKEIEEQYKKVIKEKEKMIKDKELELLRKLQDIKAHYEEELQENTISDEAQSYLRTI